jgi:hypothetical protein
MFRILSYNMSAWRSPVYCFWLHILHNRNVLYILFQDNRIDFICFVVCLLLFFVFVFCFKKKLFTCKSLFFLSVQQTKWMTWTMTSNSIHFCVTWPNWCKATERTKVSVSNNYQSCHKLAILMLNMIVLLSLAATTVFTNQTTHKFST